jgi:hypothetical protein
MIRISSEPWWSPETIDFVASILKSTDKIFEYGSGSSTLWFAKKVMSVHSVEHNERWYGVVKKCLPKNAILTHMPLPGIKRHLKRRLRGNNGLRMRSSWRKYPEVIKQYSDKYFDFVCIDGRLRRLCSLNALSKVKPGGWFMLHDSNRFWYQCIVQQLQSMPCYYFKEPQACMVWNIKGELDHA